MTQQSQVYNPFMLMIQPEVVLAAMENSEHLSRLNRHLCRPLDRPVLQGQAPVVEAQDIAADDEFDDAH